MKERKKEIYSEDENVENFQEKANIIKNGYILKIAKRKKESYSDDENFKRNECHEELDRF